MIPLFEVAHVLRAQWNAIEKSVAEKHFNTWQLRTLSALAKCRTSALGGHIDGCTGCGTLRMSYNSCRNRHCPKCQGNERQAWIRARENELLPVAYFHVVFTLPAELNTLCLQYPKMMYDSLFAAAWDTICTFAMDPKHLGAVPGMISILHTWGQELTLHPHLHCIIPAGGITSCGQWKHCKTKGMYLFPVKAMSVVFRAKYMQHIRKAVAIHHAHTKEGIVLPQSILDACFKKNWIVFAKQPFSGVGSVVEYLGRYTHKIAISNHRITAINEQNDTVTFRYKDYRDNGKSKSLTLASMEFIRRFSMHILPKRFVRIRHFGFLSSTAKIKAIPRVRTQLPPKPIKTVAITAEVYNPLQCPCCKQKTMVRLLLFDQRGPPLYWRIFAKKLLSALIID